MEEGDIREGRCHGGRPGRAVAEGSAPDMGGCGVGPRQLCEAAGGARARQQHAGPRRTARVATVLG
jgi:hypothetical protein